MIKCGKGSRYHYWNLEPLCKLYILNNIDAHFVEFFPQFFAVIVRTCIDQNGFAASVDKTDVAESNRAAVGTGAESRHYDFKTVAQMDHSPFFLKMSFRIGYKKDYELLNMQFNPV